MPYQSILRAQVFAGQNLIVTGGGSGIGRCVAHELASLGATPILVGRNADKLARVQQEILEDGGAADTLSLDIREEEAVRAGVAQLVTRHGDIHGLVNNAGGQFPAPLALMSQRGWETVIRTNLTGGFLMARECFLQSMRDHGGAIVNVAADMWGGMPLMGHSGAARAGMVNFTQSAAVEWASAGVRVNAVAPGWVASSGLDSYTDPNVRKRLPRLRHQVPLKRLAEEAEVSSVICFLLSAGAAYLTGVCVPIDGGSTLNVRAFDLPDHQKAPPFGGFHRAVRPRILEQE